MKRPNRLNRIAALCLAMLTGLGAAVAQPALPIEYRHRDGERNWLNYQAGDGVPISQEVGNPAGSNGEQPDGNESTGVFTPPTGGQFRGFLAVGGAPGLKKADWEAVSNSTVLQNGASPFSDMVAVEMKSQLLSPS